MISNVLQTLYEDHANLERLFKLIEDEIGRIDDADFDPYFETLTLALEYCVDYPCHYHHPAEDLIYGALIRRAPELARKLVVITADHKALLRVTEAFSNAVASAVEGGAAKPVRVLGQEFLGHYRHHMRVEEAEIFPAAQQHLTPSDWSGIEMMAKIPIDPLFTDHVREAYRALNRRIVARGVKSNN